MKNKEIRGIKERKIVEECSRICTMKGVREVARDILGEDKDFCPFRMKDVARIQDKNAESLYLCGFPTFVL